MHLASYFDRWPPHGNGIRLSVQGMVGTALSLIDLDVRNVCMPVIRTCLCSWRVCMRVCKRTHARVQSVLHLCVHVRGFVCSLVIHLRYSTRLFTRRCALLCEHTLKMFEHCTSVIQVHADKQDLKRTLEREARWADQLLLWECPVSLLYSLRFEMRHSFLQKRVPE
jgi:hypothetical protein